MMRLSRTRRVVAVVCGRRKDSAEGKKMIGGPSIELRELRVFCRVERHRMNERLQKALQLGPKGSKGVGKGLIFRIAIGDYVFCILFGSRGKVQNFSPVLKLHGEASLPLLFLRPLVSMFTRRCCPRLSPHCCVR